MGKVDYKIMTPEDKRSLKKFTKNFGAKVAAEIVFEGGKRERIARARMDKFRESQANKNKK